MKTAMQQLIDWINSDYRTQIDVEIKCKQLLEGENANNYTCVLINTKAR